MRSESKLDKSQGFIFVQHRPKTDQSSRYFSTFTQTHDIIENQNKVALITGASGGLGAATVDVLTKNGWYVFASDVHPEVLNRFEDNPMVTPLIIDITSETSVANGLVRIQSHTSHLDALIHMAGILQIGSVVELPLSTLEQSLDVNLKGTYRMNKTFLPLLLAHSGRILILGSEVGVQTAAPFNGPYSITKHALEAYADALRRELSFLGIKVIKIQPGPFQTTMTENAEQLFIQAKKDSRYFKSNISKGLPYLSKVYENAHNPALVSSVILKALESSNPKTAYRIKLDMPRRILELLPVKWADWIIKKMLS